MNLELASSKEQALDHFTIFLASLTFIYEKYSSGGCHCDVPSDNDVRPSRRFSGLSKLKPMQSLMDIWSVFLTHQNDTFTMTFVHSSKDLEHLK